MLVQHRFEHLSSVRNRICPKRHKVNRNDVVKKIVTDEMIPPLIEGATWIGDEGLGGGEATHGVVPKKAK